MEILVLIKINNKIIVHWPWLFSLLTSIDFLFNQSILSIVIECHQLSTSSTALVRKVRIVTSELSFKEKHIDLQTAWTYKWMNIFKGLFTWRKILKLHWVTGSPHKLCDCFYLKCYVLSFLSLEMMNFDLSNTGIPHNHIIGW